MTSVVQNFTVNNNSVLKMENWHKTITDSVIEAKLDLTHSFYSPYVSSMFLTHCTLHYVIWTVLTGYEDVESRDV